MSAPPTAAESGLGLGNACDCGAVRWRVETFADVSPFDDDPYPWPRLTSGHRRWTCLECGAEYLTKLRVSDPRWRLR